LPTEKIQLKRNTHVLNLKKQYKTVFNGDTAYVTQLKQQNQKGAITFAATCS